jgi:hypothetical protein
MIGTRFWRIIALRDLDVNQNPLQAAIPQLPCEEQEYRAQQPIFSSPDSYQMEFWIISMVNLGDFGIRGDTSAVVWTASDVVFGYQETCLNHGGIFSRVSS